MSVIFSLEAPYRGSYELHRLTFGSGSPPGGHRRGHARQ